MYTVLKRDGKVVDFDLQKISDAISLAFDAQERQYNNNIIDDNDNNGTFLEFWLVSRHEKAWSQCAY